MIISVIGGSKASPEMVELAEQVGRELAKRGLTVACGGLSGVMEAVCRGAKSEGGTTIGILPGTDPAQANEWVDIPICTGMGYARNVIVVNTGRAVIAVDGEYGTLSEIGHALGNGVPVVGLLNTLSFSMNGNQNRGMVMATDPAEAVEKALQAAEQRGPGRGRPKLATADPW